MCVDQVGQESESTRREHLGALDENHQPALCDLRSAAPAHAVGGDQPPLARNQRNRTAGATSLRTQLGPPRAARAGEGQSIRARTVHGERVNDRIRNGNGRLRRDSHERPVGVGCPSAVVLRNALPKRGWRRKNRGARVRHLLERRLSDQAQRTGDTGVVPFNRVVSQRPRHGTRRRLEVILQFRLIHRLPSAHPG